MIALVLITPTEAYRKRKGSGFKSAYWAKAPEEDLKVDTTVRGIFMHLCERDQCLISLLFHRLSPRSALVVLALVIL